MSKQSKEFVRSLERLMKAGGPELNAFKRTFQLIAIAEEEIERAGGRANPKAWGLFSKLQPGVLASYELDDLYRRHCRELIERAQNGEDLSPATGPEVLAHLSQMSLRVPFNNDFAMVFELLYEEVAGKAVPGEAPRESWPGRASELLEEMRRKFRVHDRNETRVSFKQEYMGDFLKEEKR